jgi:ethanolamine ammonia-lyase small subunit
MKLLVEANPWQQLRQFTQARIALGRAGNSLPTRAVLEFGMAHAQARDAVHASLHQASLLNQLHDAGLKTVCVHSAAGNREQYLRRPDYGRVLSEDSRQLLCEQPSKGFDVVVVIADGLSAVAPDQHAMPLIKALMSLLDDCNWGPIVVAEQARVALGDEVGERLQARQLIMLIGERPGLSSPDSLGIYLTHEPRVGRTDAERNCISNVRPAGLGYAAAAHKLCYLMAGARRLGQSGVALKDDSDGRLSAQMNVVDSIV